MFNELKRKVFEAVDAGNIEIEYMNDTEVVVRSEGEVRDIYSTSPEESIKSMIDWIDSLSSSYDEFLDEVDGLLLDIFNLTRDINRARFKERGDINVYFMCSPCVVSVTIFNDDAEIYDKTAYLGDTIELDYKNQELALSDLKDIIFMLDSVFGKEDL